MDFLVPPAVGFPEIGFPVFRPRGSIRCKLLDTVNDPSAALIKVFDTFIGFQLGSEITRGEFSCLCVVASLNTVITPQDPSVQSLAETLQRLFVVAVLRSIRFRYILCRTVLISRAILSIGRLRSTRIASNSRRGCTRRRRPRRSGSSRGGLTRRRGGGGCRLVICLLAARRKQGAKAHECAAAQQGAAIENGRIHRRYAPIVGDGVLFSYWSGRLSQVKLTTGRKTAP